MALCPGGTQPKATTPGIIIAAGALLEFLLVSRLGAFGPFVSVLGPLAIESRILCNGDPPAWPDFEPADFISLATGHLTENVKQAIMNVLWYQFCECVGTTTPAPPPAPTPEDVPAYIPGPALPCSQFHLQYSPTTAQTTPKPLYGAAGASIGLVAGATWVNVRTSVVAKSGAVADCGHYEFVINWTDQYGTFLSETTTAVGYVGDNNTESNQTTSVPSQARGFYITGRCIPPVDACCFEGDILAADYAFTCGDERGATQAECCPPDPILVAKIDYLMSQLDLVLERMGEAGPLLELATTPIVGESWVLLDPAARQINIHLSTLGQGTSMVPYANPDRLMRAGTIRFGNDFGWRRREHVDNTDCLFVVPADSTMVSWSLSPGTAGQLVQLGTPPEASGAS